MSYEDKTLVCTQCKSEFVFSAGEQAFYAEKGLTSEPKRCKACRDVRRQKEKNAKRGGGIYRSPAFEDSAPSHQKIRGGYDGRRRGRGEYRSPGLNDRRRRSGEYRSPAFREHEIIKPEQEYRAPGFREYDQIKPDEEYRSPGFREYADIDVKEEYRAPGYRETAEKYLDERPMFAIVCGSCGEKAMVPFLPEEREEVFCEACYRKKREERRAAAEAAWEGDAKADEAPEKDTELEEPQSE